MIGLNLGLHYASSIGESQCAQGLEEIDGGWGDRADYSRE